jgi:hypothetical protein
VAPNSARQPFGRIVTAEYTLSAYSPCREMVGLYVGPVYFGAIARVTAAPR